MTTIVYFLVAILISVWFIFLCENLGYLLSQIVKFASFKISKSSQKSTETGFVINLFLGFLVFTIFTFYLGILNILYSQIILGFGFVAPIIVFIIFKRYREINFKKKLLSIIENKYLFIGLGFYFLVSLPLFLKPAIGFDYTWYHLPIPKLFLQNHNVNKLDDLFFYSLHPESDFFFNLWPLSFAINQTIVGLVTNFIQFFTLILGWIFVALKTKKLLKLNNLVQIFFIPLIAINFVSVKFSGWGYNDLYGMIFGLCTIIYIQRLLSKSNEFYDDEINSDSRNLEMLNRKKTSFSLDNKISLSEFLIVILLLTNLFLVKAFFGFTAILIFIYFLFESYNKLEFLDITSGKFKFKNIFSFKILSILAFLFGIFTIFILAWVIRSYYFSKHLLDPISPELNQIYYNVIGVKNASEYWGSFVLQRFNKEFINLFTFAVTPIFGLGLFSIINSKIRQKFLNLWFFAVSTFILLFYISTITEYRYFLVPVSVLVLLGIFLINEITANLKLYAKSLLTTSLFILVVYTGALFPILDPESRADYYNLFKSTPDQFLLNRSNHKSYTYYLLDSTKVPANYNRNDKIFTLNIHNLGYINNPIQVDLNNFNDVKEEDNIKAINLFFKEQNIKYIIVQNDKDSICIFANTRKNNPKLNCENLNISEFFTKVLEDSNQKVNWYTIN